MIHNRRKLTRLAAALGLAAAPLAFAGVGLSHATAAAPSYESSVSAFYRNRGGAPLWFSPSSGNAAQLLVQLLATSRADNLDPNRYRVRNLTKALRSAQSRDPEAVRRADMMLSEAFVAYARDMKHDPHVGIIYVDPQLRPQPDAPLALLQSAAAAPSLTDYIQNLRWMNPIYAQLRQALASRMYGNEHQRQLLAVNLERARVLPSGNGRYVIVNPAAQRLYMYDDGHVVDQMRVIAGRPDPIAQTPMMAAYIRYEALNPYWNSPADLTAKLLAPRVIKGGMHYIRSHGYEILSDWSDHAHVIDPMSVNWHAVVAGRIQVRMRQKPGPANSMGRMKFMFPNAQGIWLHDTPEKEKLDDAARLQSNGCVRLQDAPRFARWLFNGHPPRPQGAKPEQKVNLPSPVPLYITYLTAVPSGTSIVYFDDFYGRDAAQLRNSRLASN